MGRAGLSRGLCLVDLTAHNTNPAPLAKGPALSL